ncbi:MAG: NAD-dependent epimerase/dehydratase family protein [Nitrospiraceae bacterium]|nr:MAG: NAD-dependent epimerase/dehydratase family protein [Nitrospiraceae bacterium]
MKRKALIVGGTGFVGLHLQHCLHDRYSIMATGRNEDIRDAAMIKNLVRKATPDIVINLAAITTVRESFERQYDNYNIGLFGTLNLLLALKDIAFQGRMLQVGSSEVYGFPAPDQLPISESEPLRPMSPYAVNKVAIEALCYQWSQTEQFEIVTTRSFTHIGPGQSDRFAISNFARQIAEIKQMNIEPVIHVGDLSATRDFTDVRDIVSAYDLLLQKGRNGDIYNVCSNQEVSTQWMLEKLIELSGVKVKIIQDTTRLRTSEQRRVCGNNRKLVRDTGWQQIISLESSLADILSYWEKNFATYNVES